MQEVHTTGEAASQPPIPIQRVEPMTAKQRLESLIRAQSAAKLCHDIIARTPPPPEFDAKEPTLTLIQQLEGAIDQWAEHERGKLR